MNWTNLQINAEQVAQQLIYDPKSPMLFNTGLFLWVFLFFMAFYQFVQQKTTSRIVYIIAFSYYFYYKSSGHYVLLLALSTLVNYYLALLIASKEKPLNRKVVLVIALIFNLGMLGYFKYTNFLIDIFNKLSLTHFDFTNIFLPIGISFFTFQILSYIIDIYRGNLKPLTNLSDFAFFVSFFPSILAGPIVRPQVLIPQIRKPVILSREDISRAIFLIAAGLFKKAIISDYISLNYVDRIFDNPTLYSGFENLMGAYGYTLQIYCDFSGYSDVAIGIALLMGFKLKDNFNLPYRSASLTEFWRRWHISLSTWLRDYLYIPLGGNRKGKLRQYLNLFITMLLGGLWHGASLKFIMWGGMHGSMLAVEKMISPFTRKQTGKLWRLGGILITFHFVTLCWIFFRADSFNTAIQVIHQVATKFNASIALEVVTAYKPVFFLFALGYTMHFTPQIITQKLQLSVAKAPAFAQALLLVMVIWLIIQTKSANVQPFIYFQF
ncbi:MAG: MBOAT family protein [Bacteroidetes bacterium]|nr:MBOAT family protein [Bacteroidota bacterium]